MKNFFIKVLICSLILGCFVYMKNCNNSTLNNWYVVVKENLSKNLFEVSEVYSFVSDKVNAPTIESSISTQIPNY